MSAIEVPSVLTQLNERPYNHPHLHHLHHHLLHHHHALPTIRGAPAAFGGEMNAVVFLEDHLAWILQERQQAMQRALTAVSTEANIVQTVINDSWSMIPLRPNTYTLGELSEKQKAALLDRFVHVNRIEQLAAHLQCEKPDDAPESHVIGCRDCMCPVCFDKNIESWRKWPCCQYITCGPCVDVALKHNLKCPACRHSFAPPTEAVVPADYLATRPPEVVIAARTRTSTAAATATATAVAAATSTSVSVTAAKSAARTTQQKPTLPIFRPRRTRTSMAATAAAVRTRGANGPVKPENTISRRRNRQHHHTRVRPSASSYQPREERKHQTVRNASRDFVARLQERRAAFIDQFSSALQQSMSMNARHRNPGHPPFASPRTRITTSVATTPLAPRMSACTSSAT